VTPIDLSDLEQLMAVDRHYAAATEVDSIVDRASVHFYQRSGHSFAARGTAAARGSSAARNSSATRGSSEAGSSDELLGFMLAHASWSGGRPVVRVERLAAGATDVARALVEAVVKSAYDAGVYDIVAAVPTRDLLAATALSDASFAEGDLSVYVRVLGSRGSTAVQGG